MAYATELAQKNKIKENERLTKIRNYFFQNIKNFVPSAIINGDLENRLPNNINISIPGMDGEMLVFRLDEAGFVVSSSSACASGNGESEVVKKIGTSERAKSTLRFSMGKDTKMGDIKNLLITLKKLCQKY
jgi:cysteine desulfurase